MYAGVPFFETVFMDRFAGRLPVFLTKGETWESNVRLHEGRSYWNTRGSEHIV